MTPETFGRFALIVVGALVAVLVAVMMFRKQEAKAKGVVTVALGFGMMGVGAFGLPFIDHSVPVLKLLAEYVSGESGGERREIAKKLVEGQVLGEFDPSEWEVISAVMNEYPTIGLETILDEGATKALAESQADRAEAIRRTREEIELKKMLIRRETEPVSPVELLQGFDAASLRLLQVEPTLRPDLTQNPELINAELEARALRVSPQ
ncbi:MAG: hypothetical protein AAF333_04725 [Planctomycetota bacterium]